MQRDRYNDENIEAYLELKQSIEDRIEEIENFYELNFDQPYAQHFEKGRIKLKKLLMFEPFDINEIQINNGSINNKNIKNNVYEINPYKNTINTNYDNYYMDNDSTMRNRGNKANKSKKTVSTQKREKIEFIPMEVKKKSNIHSMEKLKNIKHSKMNNYMNNTKNKKLRDVDDNNIYINEQINLYNQKKYNMPREYKKNENVLNKYKKTKISSSMDKQPINNRYYDY